jgi:hypothetical protein
MRSLRMSSLLMSKGEREGESSAFLSHLLVEERAAFPSGASAAGPFSHREEDARQENMSMEQLRICFNSLAGLGQSQRLRLWFKDIISFIHPSIRIEMEQLRS